MKKLTFVILMLFAGYQVWCQDPHFSQYYAATSYLSPSLAGSSGEPRMSLNYRNQWPGIGTVYETMLASYDMYLEDFNSGLGFMVLKDRAGSTDLAQTNFSVQYSYRLQMNSKWQIIPGLQAAYCQNSIDFSKFEFADALLNDYVSNTSARTSELYMNGLQNKNYFDFGASAFLYSSDKWLGVTVDHISQPNQSFANEESKLPMKMVAFGGMNVWKTVDRNRGPVRSIDANFRYMHQGSFDQVDIGAYIYNTTVDFGVWLRAVPNFSDEISAKLNRDAIVFILKYKIDGLQIGYSYDITISNLSSHAYGSHEISLTYELSNIGLFKKLGKNPVACFPKGKDGRYSTRVRKRTRF
jgi:type IX secretion system PorP/SprF family membrane protein